MFGATYDPAPMISTNNNGFVAVIIQYRLGAFGYLGGEQVHQHGKNNAGLLDQNFALQWVQKHISKFGGDPKKVTIGGESSGAGSVMLQAMAYGGGDKYLFNNVRLHLARIRPLRLMSFSRLLRQVHTLVGSTSTTIPNQYPSTKRLPPPPVVRMAFRGMMKLCSIAWSRQTAQCYRMPVQRSQNRARLAPLPSFRRLTASLSNRGLHSSCSKKESMESGFSPGYASICDIPLTFLLM